MLFCVTSELLFIKEFYFIMPMQIAIMVICLIMSGYFSATETAFLSINKTRLKTMVENGNKRAALVLKLEENYDRLISTILIGNNIVNILLSSIGTILFIDIMRSQDMGSLVSTIVCTVVVLIFGEITPKNLAKQFPDAFAMFSAPIIRFLGWILMPVNVIFMGWRKLISLIIRPKEEEKMSQEELLMFVEEVQQEGSIDDDEGDLLRNAIEFTDRKAEDILTHRVEIEGVPVTASKEDVLKVFADTRFSRLVVYEDTIDNVVGIINHKNFYENGCISQKDIKDIMTPPLFIHKSEKIIDLLKLLQKNKAHIAVVVDEYGGTLGIVTMEDILEELVGDIWDEHDEVVDEYKQIAEDAFIVDCAVNFEDFCERFDIRSDSDSISLGGWITEQLDKIPVKGDQFDFAHLNFRVTKADLQHVVSVKVTVGEKLDEDEDKKDKE